MRVWRCRRNKFLKEVSRKNMYLYFNFLWSLQKARFFFFFLKLFVLILKLWLTVDDYPRVRYYVENEVDNMVWYICCWQWWLSTWPIVCHTGFSTLATMVLPSAVLRYLHWCSDACGKTLLWATASFFFFFF